MVDTIESFLNIAVTYIWGLPMVYSLLGAGVFFTLSLGGIQFRGFKHAIDVVCGKYKSKDDVGEISPFQALTTALLCLNKVVRDETKSYFKRLKNNEFKI